MSLTSERTKPIAKQQKELDSQLSSPRPSPLGHWKLIYGAALKQVLYYVLIFTQEPQCHIL